MSKKTSEPETPAPVTSQTRTIYVNVPDQVLSEIDQLVATSHLARGRFLGHLLALGLTAYKDGKGSMS